MKQDVEVLSREFDVKVFHFDPSIKAFAPLTMLRQYFFLKRNKGAVYVSLFAGYHSWLPGVFARKHNLQHLIVLGGTDCVSFPSFNYGNFNKATLGKYTRRSFELATHLAPVDESLVDTDYTYTTGDPKKQGYKNFVKEVKAPHTTIHFGYDHEKFKPLGEKVKRSFITVGYLNPANYYRKGIDLVLHLAGRFDDCTFTIIGGTKADLPPSTEVPENVQLIGSTSYDDLVKHYASHQFYLQLSMMEGFPSSICEAMLCECVPIGSDVAAIPTIIGDTGFVLKHKDTGELEELVRKALSSADHAWGQRARQRIMEKYPADERAKLLELVKRIMG